MSAVEWRAQHKADKDADQGHRRQQVWFTGLSGLFVATGFAVHVGIAGGFGESLRLFAGHDGAWPPWLAVDGVEAPGPFYGRRPPATRVELRLDTAQG